MPPRSDGQDRGIAIVAALWMTAIVAIVVMSVLQLTKADAKLNRGRADVVQLHAIADAAINIAILAMLGPANTHPPVTGVPFTVRFADQDIAVSVIDESGKIDLNRATPKILSQMLLNAGLESGEAEAMAARIVDWRTAGDDRQPGGGGDESYYLAGRRIEPRNAPFQSVEELRLIQGMTDGLYRRIAPILTVYSQTQWIDPSFAGVRVLSVFSPTDAGARAALRRLQDVRRGAAPQPRSPGVTIGHAFTITAEAVDRKAGARTTRSAVVRLTGQPNSPLLIYRWD